MNDFGRCLDVELGFGGIVDVPDLQFLVAAAAGDLLLVRIHCDRPGWPDMPLEVANQIPAADIPILDDPVITDGEMMC